VSLFPGNQAIELGLRDHDNEDHAEDEVVIAVMDGFDSTTSGLAQTFAQSWDDTAAR
jgi:muramidase (phage lysozyme)